MATVKVCRHALFLRLLDTRAFHLSRNCWKLYRYDLDSLLKWKQETKQLFGPQRKPTKTGKLKKRTKPLDKQLQENVEILSCMSKTVSTQHLLDCRVHVSSLDANSGKTRTDPANTKWYSHHLSQSTGFVLGQEEISFYKEYGSSYEIDRDRIRHNKNYSLKESEVKNARQKNNIVSISQNNLKQTFVPDEGETSQSKKVKVVNSSRQTCEQANVVDSQKHMADDKKHEVIDIPKIEPVPSGENVSASKKVLLPTMGDPPIEAPLSFNIIPNFPLTPRGSNMSQDDAEAERLRSFKTDVEQMALRVLPSVKTVLNKTMSDLNRFFLNRWREGMINELGEEGFQKYKNETMRQGINLHANIMEYLSGKEKSDIQIMPENEGHWTSLHTALQSVSDIRALEMDILHPALLYKGVFDCVAQYKDLLCVIDWKVSKKPRPLLKNTYDDPLQVAAYVGAMNASERHVNQYGEINHGLIVVAYPDGSPAHMHLMSRVQVEQYWREWTSRLHDYYTLIYTEKLGAKQLAGAAAKT